MLNNVTLTGRLGKDVELKYTESGLAVASGTLAVSRRFQTKNGEREVDWINFVIWRKAAENFANFTHKGSLVGLEGRIQTRNYENQEGTRVYVTEVVVENFSFLEPKGAVSNSQAQSSAPQSTGTAKQTNPKNDPFANGNSSIDISNEDLPF
ncbi:single-stranded DNA-binding protein [Secundilactobacillus oryzae JCM 18671]|uniref:Single-stranded DNA-binding protein n=1 Tax=Secundilactobacillus oryzae JCM 18671 TaxID=1291743 RepID=A0A081BI73_9LACO|nr:single-stranded DNA-binding protein [Secundilactobacillus oryzae]GAK47741.1 single-stranded DNA-binding protein [Secundilactobacillus oryzae JCM 18671]